RALDLTRVRGLLAAPVMVDLRNIYNPADMAKAGFDYTSIGRPHTAPNPTAPNTTAQGTA
ncbi:MAG TPA: hypothetical protein VGE72_16745, partial [Azospirillum sp.]